MKRILFQLAFIFSAFIATAQNIDAGLFLGTSFYNGDILVKPKFLFKEIKPALGGFIRLPIGDVFALRVQGFRGTLYADEKLYPVTSFRQSRGFSFKTPITEVSMQGEWHFLKLDNSFYITDLDPVSSTYLFGGLGVTMFSPRAIFNEPNPIFDDVSIDKYAKYSKTTVVIPIGLGTKFRLGESFRLGLEFGARASMSDYIDGISKLSARKNLDYYFFAGTTLSWEFGSGGGGYGSGGGLFSGLFGGGGSGSGAKSKKAGCPTF